MHDLLLFFLSFVDDFAADDCVIDFCCHDLVVRAGGEVSVEDDDVAEVTGFYHSFAVFHELSVGGAECVEFDGFFHREFLVGEPSVAGFSGAVFSCDGGVHSFKGVDWFDGVVGAEGYTSACVEEAFLCVCSAASFFADSFFGEAFVGDGVSGLHGGDDADLCKAGEVVVVQALCVFDAVSSLSRAVDLGELFEGVEYPAVALIADGVYAELEASFIGGDSDSFEIFARHHGEAGGFGYVEVWFEEEACAGAECAVDEAFEVAESYPVAVEGILFLQFGVLSEFLFVVGEDAAEVNAGCEFIHVFEFLVHFDAGAGGQLY